MWVVVHFLKNNTIESVPNVWFNKKDQNCAWPLSKNSVKRMIGKRIYPTNLNFNGFQLEFANIHMIRNMTKFFR